MEINNIIENNETPLWSRSKEINLITPIYKRVVFFVIFLVLTYVIPFVLLTLPSFMVLSVFFIWLCIFFFTFIFMYSTMKNIYGIWRLKKSLNVPILSFKNCSQFAILTNKRFIQTNYKYDYYKADYSSYPKESFDFKKAILFLHLDVVNFVESNLNRNRILFLTEEHLIRHQNYNGVNKIEKYSLKKLDNLNEFVYIEFKKEDVEELKKFLNILHEILKLEKIRENSGVIIYKKLSL